LWRDPAAFFSQLFSNDRFFGKVEKELGIRNLMDSIPRASITAALFHGPFVTSISLAQIRAFLSLSRSVFNSFERFQDSQTAPNDHIRSTVSTPNGRLIPIISLPLHFHAINLTIREGIEMTSRADIFSSSEFP
jgi:hypothetical protein